MKSTTVINHTKKTVHTPICSQFSKNRRCYVAVTGLHPMSDTRGNNDMDLWCDEEQVMTRV